MSAAGDGHRPEDTHRALPVAPNVKPKLGQNDRNRKPNHQKKDKPAKVRRSRSTDSERTDRGRTRDRHPRGERRQRGRSEEAQRRGRKEEEVKPPEDDVEETECPICFCSYNNVFKTPKLLACGHTFCLECLARINVSSPVVKTLPCPVCRMMTEVPHGKDLPHLSNNEDIIGKLPADMQRALSIRFKRSKGKLVLKNPPPNSVSESTVASRPKQTPNVQPAADSDLHASAVERGEALTTAVDVGRPPNRFIDRMRTWFRSGGGTVIVIVTVSSLLVVLALSGILAFAISPFVAHNRPPPAPGNQTLHPNPTAGVGFSPQGGA